MSTEAPLRDYETGFRLSNRDAVAKVVAYIQQQKLPVRSIVVEMVDDKTAVVHMHTSDGSDTDALHQINWGKPDAMPSQYEGYGNRFYRFTGPAQVQQQRAQLLANAFGILVGITSSEGLRSLKGNEYMGMGVRVFNKGLLTITPPK